MEMSDVTNSSVPCVEDVAPDNHTSDHNSSSDSIVAIKMEEQKLDEKIDAESADQSQPNSDPPMLVSDKDKQIQINKSFVEGISSKNDSVPSDNTKNTTMKWLGLNTSNKVQKKRKTINDGSDDDDDAVVVGNNSQSQILKNRAASSAISENDKGNTGKRKPRDSQKSTSTSSSIDVIPKKKKPTPAISAASSFSEGDSGVSPKSSLLAHLSPPQVPVSGNPTPNSSHKVASTKSSVAPSTTTSSQSDVLTTSGSRGGHPAVPAGGGGGGNRKEGQSSGNRSPTRSSATNAAGTKSSVKNDAVAQSKITKRLSPPQTSTVDNNNHQGSTQQQQAQTRIRVSREVSSYEMEKLNKLKNACNMCLYDTRFMNLVNGKPSTRGLSIDVSGSFLRKEDDDHKFDFLDHDANGNIVVKPRPPMFPEELPPGVRDMPLSWWGILDPAIGDRKYSPITTNDVEHKEGAISSTVATASSKVKDDASNATIRSPKDKGINNAPKHEQTTGNRRGKTSNPAVRSNSGQPLQGGSSSFDGPPRNHGPWGAPPVGYPPRRGDGPVPVPPNFYWNGRDGHPPPPSYWNGHPHRESGPYPPHHHWNDHGPGRDMIGGRDGPWNGPPPGTGPSHSRHRDVVSHPNPQQGVKASSSTHKGSSGRSNTNDNNKRKPR